MAYRTLRSWLQHLAATDRLALAEPGVDLDFEVAAVAKRQDGSKAVIFPAPKRGDGNAPNIPVVANLLAERSWVAESLGVAPDEVLARFRHAVEQPLPSEEVEDAPVQQSVIHDPDLLRDLPIPLHNEHDSGPYISAGLVIARNPRTGVQNVSINRLQITSGERMGILMLPRHLHTFFQMAEEVGDALEVAVAIGVDPATLLASQAVVPIDFDELEVAGALHGAPLRVVKCVTNEVRVPADAEVVIEGRLLPGVREMEGPFAEFPQYYGPAGRREVIQVDAITTRAKPMFHTIVSAGMEHLLLGAIPREATIVALLQRSFPGVIDVNLSQGGVCRYHLNVKMKKRHEGEPKNVIAGAFSAHADIKQVIVVDDDVDVHDPTSVEWAVATRFQASKDIVILAGALGSKLDPSADDGVSDKMGLDATMPVKREGLDYVVVHVPGEDDPKTDERVIGAVDADDAILEEGPIQ
jgi:2,5-furandicarboxylate decarboxylase 1